MGGRKGQIPWNKGLKGVQAAWNKGLTKETDERVKKYGKNVSKGRKGIEPYNKGVPRTEEEKRLMSENRKGKNLGNQNAKGKNLGNKWGKKNFKYGSYTYWHNKAWKKVGKPYCEICGITLMMSYKVSGRRLEMHHKLDPPDYTNLNKKSWQTTCNNCHLRIIHGTKENQKDTSD